MDPLKLLLFSGNLKKLLPLNSDYCSISFNEPVIVDEIRIVANGKPCHQKLRHVSLTSKDPIKSLKFYGNDLNSSTTSSYKLIASVEENTVVESDLTLYIENGFPVDVVIFEGEFGTVTCNIYGVLYSSVLNNETFEEVEEDTGVESLNNINKIETDNNTYNTPTYETNNNENDVQSLQPSFAMLSKNDPEFGLYINDPLSGIFSLFDAIFGTILTDSPISEKENEEGCEDSLLIGNNEFNTHQVYIVSTNSSFKSYINQEFYRTCSSLKNDKSVLEKFRNEYDVTWRSLISFYEDTIMLKGSESKFLRFLDEFELILAYVYVNKLDTFGEFCNRLFSVTSLKLKNLKNIDYYPDDINIYVLFESYLKILKRMIEFLPEDLFQVDTKKLDWVFDVIAYLYADDVCSNLMKTMIADFLMAISCNYNLMVSFLKKKILQNSSEISLYEFICKDFLSENSVSSYDSLTWRPEIGKLLKRVKLFYAFYRTNKILSKTVKDVPDQLVLNLNDSEKDSLFNNLTFILHTIQIISKSKSADNFKLKSVIMRYCVKMKFLKNIIIVLSSELINFEKFLVLIKMLLLSLATSDYGLQLLFYQCEETNFLITFLLGFKINEDSTKYTSIKDLNDSIENVYKISWKNFSDLFIHELEVYQLMDQLQRSTSKHENNVIENIDATSIPMLVKILLNNPVGYDAVIRSVLIPKHFNSLLRILYSTLHLIKSERICEIPISVVHVVYILMKAFESRHINAQCLIHNVSVIIDLVVILKGQSLNVELGCITDWFVPVLSLIEENNYTENLCNFLKNELSDFVLDLSSSRIVCSAFMILHELYSMAGDPNEFMANLLASDFIFILHCFSLQLDVLSSRRNFVRNVEMTDIIMNCLNCVVHLIDAVVLRAEQIQSSQDCCSDSGLSNKSYHFSCYFDRKLCKLISNFAVFSLLVDSQSEIYERCTQILIRYVYLHSSNMSIATNSVAFVSCSHYVVRYLLKLSLKRLECFYSSICFLVDLLPDDRSNTLFSKSYSRIWEKSIQDNFSAVKSVAIRLLQCSSNIYIVLLTRLVTKISFISASCLSLLTTFLIEYFLDCIAEKKSFIFVNMLSLFDVILQIPLTVICSVKYLASVMNMTIDKNNSTMKDNFFVFLSYATGENEIDFNSDKISKYLLTCIEGYISLPENYGNYYDSKDLEFISVLIRRFLFFMSKISFDVAKLDSTAPPHAMSDLDKTENEKFTLLKDLLNFYYIVTSNKTTKEIFLKVYRMNHTLLNNVIGNLLQIGAKQELIYSLLMFLDNLIPFSDSTYKCSNFELSKDEIFSIFESHHQTALLEEYISEECSIYQKSITEKISRFELEKEEHFKNKSELHENEVFPECVTFNSFFSSKEFDCTVLNMENLGKREHVEEYTQINFGAILDFSHLSETDFTSLTTSTMYIPSYSNLKQKVPTGYTDSTITLVNNSILSMNSELNNARTNLQLEMWVKNRCTTSRLPSLRVDDFTAIINQNILSDNIVKLRSKSILQSLND